MTSRDFCYWLQGYIEIASSDTDAGEFGITPEQVQCIQKHLNMVFLHEIDPSHGDQAMQDALTETHSGGDADGLVMRC